MWIPAVDPREDVPSVPQLPPELLLHVASFCPARTRLELSYACRDWYPLLYPYEDLKAIVTWRGENERILGTDYELVRLAQDSLNIGKLRLVDTLRICDTPVKLNWSLTMPVISACSRLRSLELAFTGHEALSQLSSIALSLTTLVDLRLDFWNAWLLPGVELHFPSLKTATLWGNPCALLCSALARDCPSLEEVSLVLMYAGDEVSDADLTELRALPDLFLAKVRKFASRPLSLLAELSSRISFRPRKFDMDALRIWAETVALDHTIPEDWDNLWRTVIKADFFEEIQLARAPLSILRLGLPKNTVRKLNLNSMLPSKLTIEELRKIEKLLLAHPAEKVFVFDDIQWTYWSVHSAEKRAEMLKIIDFFHYGSAVGPLKNYESLRESLKSKPKVNAF